jgi:hypothetical protein
VSGEPTDIKGFPASERAGCRLLRRVRGRGVVVGLYHAADAGIAADAPLRWACVCETHSSVVLFRTIEGARSWLSHPEDWCPDCRNIGIPAPGRNWRAVLDGHHLARLSVTGAVQGGRTNARDAGEGG